MDDSAGTRRWGQILFLTALNRYLRGKKNRIRNISIRAGESVGLCVKQLRPRIYGRLKCFERIYGYEGSR